MRKAIFAFADLLERLISWGQEHILLNLLLWVAVVFVIVLSSVVVFNLTGGPADLDRAYTADVRKQAASEIGTRNDEALILMGHQACGMLDSGRATQSDLTDRLTAEGIGGNLAAAVVTSAAREYCPDWLRGR